MTIENFNEFKQFFSDNFSKIKENVNLVPIISSSLNKSVFNPNRNLEDHNTQVTKITSIYLNTLTELGVNRKFLKGVEYDCDCCNNTLGEIADILSLDKDDKLITMWDGYESLSCEYFKEVSKRIYTYLHGKVLELNSKQLNQDLLKEFSLLNLDESEIGRDYNWSIDKEQKFYHLHLKDTSKFKNTLSSDKKLLHIVVFDTFNKLNIDSLNMVIELSDSELYRGKEFLPLLESFKEKYIKYLSLTTNFEKIIFLLNFVKNNPNLVSFKNTSIGSLVMDLSEGLDFDKSVKSYTKKVDPENYQRRENLAISPVILNKFKKLLEEKGYSLNSRHVQNINELPSKFLWKNNSVYEAIQYNKDDVLTSLVSSSKKSFKGLPEVNISEFIDNVLPTCNNLEAYLDSSDNLFTMLTSDSPSIFKWDNSFRIIYNNGLADAIHKKATEKGAYLDATICVTLSWHNIDDLDLNCVEPNGNVISFRNKMSWYTGGKLDIDMNAGSYNLSDNPVENIFHNDITKLKPGIYTYNVDQFRKNADKNFGFDIRVKVNDEIYVTSSNISPKSNNEIKVVEIEVDKNKNISLNYLYNNEKLTSSSVKNGTMWNCKTNQFHKVDMLIKSPNSWDSEKVIGNLHYMFIINNMKNPDSVRPFLNEQLNYDFKEFARIIEKYGNENQVPYSENQVCGMGYSETSKKSLIVRINNSKLLKINF